MPSPSRLPPGQLPVRHIDPDDLPDDEWDRLAAGPTPRSVAWRIGSHIEDAWRAIWQVDAARLTAHDFALYLGRPLAMSGPGGAAVILTAELVAYLERFRRAPDLIDLPLSRTTVKRLRRALGHNWYEDGERWWLRRLDDLEAMTTADFAVRYGVKLEAVTYARLNLLGPRQRPAHWWLEPATADLLLSPQPRIYIALMLDICASSVGRLRARLRHARGEPMDKASVAARVSAAKTGLPAHPNTALALRAAASRPKSDAWRAALGDRNRQRPRPQSWVEREWSAAEDAALGTMPDRAASEYLGRTIAAVRNRRRALGRRAFLK